MGEDGLKGRHRPLGPDAIVLAHFSARESSAYLAGNNYCPPI